MAIDPQDAADVHGVAPAEADRSTRRSHAAPCCPSTTRTVPAPGTAPAPGCRGSGSWSSAGGPARLYGGGVGGCWLMAMHSLSRPAVGEVGDLAAGRQSLALELGDRPVRPALHRPARPAAARRRAPRASARRSPPSRWPAATTPPGRSREAASAANSGVTSRRLWCRFLGHGSGKKVQSSSTSPGREQVLQAPHRVHREQPDVLGARLGDQTEGVRDPGSPHLQRHDVVRRTLRPPAPPSPPRRPSRSRRSAGPSRPNTSRQLNDGSSTASSGTTQSRWCASHASCCDGVNRPPRRE